MHKIKFVLRILAAVFAVPVIPNPAIADEKPEIFVRMAGNTMLYFSGLKFTQEVQTWRV